MNQLYFSSGAFQGGQREHDEELVSLEQKRDFLESNMETFYRLGDVAAPHTIYYLLDLLQFLIPADPPRVFNLVTHALLSAGKSHGFQFESMGSDRFVEIVGRFLADHRYVFADPKSREALIACLDIFVEAGWPDARRLLYRLPELL